MLVSRSIIGVFKIGSCPPQELVQVESLAQLGVQLLLFTLGLEFSMTKLRAVRSVALLGATLPPTPPPPPPPPPSARQRVFF